jgi:hypothetical protein
MRQQHWLETCLYAVDVLAIVFACVYGGLTHDGAVQGGSMRLALELGLGALLGVSVLVAVVFVGVDIALERRLIQQYHLKHGLVQMLEGTKEAAQIIDKPIVDAIRDGAVRLIDCAWLLDSSRSDEQLPRVTKVAARLASNAPRSALIRQLAAHCGTSSICITVEAASAASPVRPRWRWRWWTPPSPPEAAALEEIQLEDLSSVGRMSTFVVTFHLSTFEEVAPLTAAGLCRKAESVKERLTELGAEDIKIVMGKPFLPRCQDMPPKAFLPPERAVVIFEERRRGVRVLSYCWRTCMNDPDGRILEKIRGYLNVDMNVDRGRRGDYGLFVDFACIPQRFAWPSWHAPEAIALRFGSEVDFQGPLAVLRFEMERVATEDEAQVCVDKLVTLCEQQRWELASIADFKGLGLSSHDHVSVLFHGRYLRGVYRFDEGVSAEGFVRFRTADDADAARRHPDLKRLCGGKEPKQMGEHVFENELKFCRGLSVMGCLYASATGTCVLQLTAPPGELGSDDDAPSELVSESTGTIFVVRTNMSLEELWKKLGDRVLACEKKGRGGEVVVRIYDKRAARAARSLNERGYPLRRKDRVVYPMYNLRPYGSRGWPTFETSAASIVLAHLTQLKRQRKALPPLIAQAEASSWKFINIDVNGAPREVVVALSPERLLRECKKKLRSKRIFFSGGNADRKVLVQLLSDFEDSIAVEFDQMRARHLNLRTEDLVRARTEELGEARRSRDRKEPSLARGGWACWPLTSHEETLQPLFAFPILHVSEPTLTVHVVPTLTAGPHAHYGAPSSEPVPMLEDEEIWGHGDSNETDPEIDETDPIDNTDPIDETDPETEFESDEDAPQASTGKASAPADNVKGAAEAETSAVAESAAGGSVLSRGRSVLSVAMRESALVAMSVSRPSAVSSRWAPAQVPVVKITVSDTGSTLAPSAAAAFIDEASVDTKEMPGTPASR